MYFNDILLGRNFIESNIDDLVSYVNTQVAEIDTFKRLYEIYALNAKQSSWNLVRSYALRLAPTQQKLSVYIDYDDLASAILNEDYTISYTNNQYVFNQLRDVVVFFTVPQNETVTITHGQNTFTVSSEDVANSPFGYAFMYVPSGTQIVFSSNLPAMNEDYLWVRKIYAAPFVQFRVFNDETVNLEDFTCMLHKKTVNASGVEITTTQPLNSNSQLQTTYDFATNVTSVPSLDVKYDILLSKLLCGKTENVQGSTIQLGKYFFELKNNVLNRYTYATVGNHIVKVEEQTVGYNVQKPIDTMNQFPTRKSLILPLSHCTMKASRFKPLLGSNYNAVELEQKRTVSQIEVQSYAGSINIQNAFLLFAMSKDSIQVVYFENINAMPRSYRLNFTPQKLYLIGNISGFVVNSGRTQDLFVEQPAKQLVLVNLTTNRVLTLIKEDGEQLILGGQKESIVQILNLAPFEYHKVMIQNNTADDQIVFQLLIESHQLATPQIQLQHGYTYSAEVKNKDGVTKADINVSLPTDNYNYYCQNAKASWILEQQQFGEFSLDDYVEIVQEQIDQFNQQAAFTVAKQHKVILDVVATLKPTKPFYDFILVLDRRELYEL